MSIQVDQTSYKRLMSNLATLPRRVGLRVFRVALNAWGGVVKAEEIKGATRGDTGLLKKSPVVKVKIPDASYNVNHHGRPAYVAVGPNRNLVAPVILRDRRAKKISIRKATKRVLGGNKVYARKPSRYAHFVEKGIAGKQHVTANPFVADAQRKGAGQGMVTFAGKIEQGIQTEAAKLPK